MSRIFFNKVAIIGVGLIGGSLGMAVKKNRLAKEVVGMARRPKTITEAIKLKAIDRGSIEPQIIKGADLVVLATPVATIIDIVPKLKKYLTKGCIVIDVGSCKQEIVSQIEKTLPPAVSFIGCHPLAGSEKKGVAAAAADIFSDSLTIITPSSRSRHSQALRKIKLLWQALGAKVVILSPKQHDKILAFLSHLPHILAFSLINCVPSQYLSLSPCSLREMTRIAASDSLLWRDILLMNRGNLLCAIAGFTAQLNKLRSMLSRSDGSRLLQILTRAKSKREKIL
ncbi:MAG: prephenate dehydrogenase [Candidatus Omnitrophota bacterium]